MRIQSKKVQISILTGILCLAVIFTFACKDDEETPPSGPTVGVMQANIAYDGANFQLSWATYEGAEFYDISHAGSRFGTYQYKHSEFGNSWTALPANQNANKYENYYKIEAYTDDGAKLLAETIVSLELNIFGPAVLFFDAKYDVMTDVEREINRIHDTEMFGSVPQGDGRNGEFATKRYTFFFKPGTYTYGTFNIGFNTHIAGLGDLPSKTILRGTIVTPTHLTEPANNATCTFWRSIENFQIDANGNNVFRWGVSQSSPVRRMLVNVPTFYHYFGGWASGGFTADCHFNSTVDGGSQQQWYTRNSHHTSALTGVGWNKVVQSTTGIMQDDEPDGSRTKIDTSPIIREKPFIYIDAAGEYKVFVPGIRTDAVGISWGEGKANNGMGVGTSLDLVNDFYITKQGDTAAAINAQITAGKHIYYTPARYECEVPVQVSRAGTIVLGNGFPALYPATSNSNGALFVHDVEDVTVAGLMFDATNSNSVYLMAVGESGANKVHAKPTLLADLCLRVGGYYGIPVHADISAIINSNNVIGDHFWVWRADHGVGALIDWHHNTSKNGVVVMGDDVTFYGLFVEHYHEYNTLWMGDRGRMYFYQNETPYDPHWQTQYKSHGGTVDGWAMYKVDNRVTQHEAVGLGMYCVFLDRSNGTKEAIYIQNSIEVPHKPGVKIRNACIQYIGSRDRGGIRTVVNGTGGHATNVSVTSAYITEFVDGIARVVGSGWNTTGIAPADEKHWVEDLVINSSGVVTNRSTGGVPNFVNP